MDSKAIFSPEHPGLRTYGCRTKSRDRQRGILLQKKQSKAPAVNVGNFSLSDDSDDIKNVKDNKRKVSSATQGRKSSGTHIQKQTRRPARRSNAKNQTKTASKEKTKQRKEENQSIQQMKSTPKHGLEQSNQMWVKAKIRGSDSEDSIELPRRDQELTWQEKISLLMPKMTNENVHHPDRKVPGYNKMPEYSVWNLSAEEVMEEKVEESSAEDETDHIQAAPRVSMPNVFVPRLSVHSPVLDKSETEHVEENNEKRTRPTDHVTTVSDDYTYTYEWVTDMADSLPASHQVSKGQGHASSLKSLDRILSQKTGNMKSSVEQTSSDVYTYEWVTDSDTGQTRPASSCSSRSGQVNPNSCPSSIVQQNKSATLVKNLEKKLRWCQSDKDRSSHGYFNSTKKPGALGVFQAKFPEDLSIITKSPSLIKDKVIPCAKASLVTVETHRNVQQMNSTRKNDGLDIDMIKLPDMSVIERSVL
ncbi:uncharacterized protein LOC117323222 [Pecten maximus]|uniref:uncharacterized protein LOC117323222 n=1 Tax=Pecten maximus TaxID=6579 RepID=UPI0014587AFB|nr:uncharacterized protein LOC117323222 [Pecten maximus]XP_033734175.1 uncharacterized protein LOC117323222 [Pecten maximus]